MALYSIATWDMDTNCYTPQVDVPAFNLTLFELRQSMRLLKDAGYMCHRIGNTEDGHENNDPMVLIERTDGRDPQEILKAWRR